MKESIKQLKLDLALSALLTAGLGLLFLLFPGQIGAIGSILVGGIMIFFGVVAIIFFLTSHRKDMTGLFSGLFSLLCGSYLLNNPSFFLRVIPFSIGMVIVAHGLNTIRLSFVNKSYQDSRWWHLLLSGIALILLGVILMLFAVQVAEMAIAVLGIALIIDGSWNFWVLHRASNAYKIYHRNADDVFDTDSREL